MNVIEVNLTEDVEVEVHVIHAGKHARLHVGRFDDDRLVVREVHEPGERDPGDRAPRRGTVLYPLHPIR